jgi:gliding motility-associated-like protein
MKRLILLISTCFLLSLNANANHITGGEMYYTLVSQSGNNYTYRVVLKLYRDCFSSGAQLDPSAAIAIFDKGTGTMVWNSLVPQQQVIRLEIGTPNPCITNPPAVCYQVGYYEFDVTLQGTVSGYTIAYQRCCRIAGINNLSNSSNVGATYTADIPGTTPISTGPANNSARFIGPDTVIVCADNFFSYSFAASDADATDTLRYSFCDAFPGGAPGAPAPNPPSAPPYSSVPYSGGNFFGSSPLGSSITIDPVTGLLTGIAPASGIYVVTVCVNEIRNGVVIATQRKDLQIKVGDCDIAKAALNPEYITCDGFTMSFRNNSTSPLINSFYWEFGDPASGAANISTDQFPTHTFSDTGVYTIKLVTNRNQQCSDSTTARVKVYPGFFPGFISNGICLLNPVFFTDTTRAAYGTVNSWKWDFGETGTNADTSRLQNPQWTYSSIGPKDVRFIVTSSKGCIDTIHQTVDIIDKPPITLAFRDTLICIPDNVQLQASGSGVFNWTPNVAITNANTATPTVNPTTTTTYYVNLDLLGCLNRDSVRVRVVSVVSLAAMPDTTICLGDAAQLRVISNGLQYNWSPSSTLNDATLSNPVATPTGTTTYQVVANIGSCAATDQVVVSTVPYPLADAGNDTTICYNTPAQLNGTFVGATFSWAPSAYLNNSTIIDPLAFPPRTTEFVLTVFDNIGCPKPGRDTVLVNVLPRIIAYAGEDTAVVIGQPLQLNASGGVSYIWSPPTGLSATNIPNPIGTYDGSVDSVRYRVDVFNDIGCSVPAFVTVKVFKTNPQIFVPSAFTPNGDGLNDVIRPISVGIQRINYFRIFNRWGQLVFSTSTDRQGWDGRISGVAQATNTFVWMVSAVDYLGKPYFQKGTVTLLR